jgi:hypothetical protein
VRRRHARWSGPTLAGLVAGAGLTGVACERGEPGRPDAPPAPVAASLERQAASAPARPTLDAPTARLLDRVRSLPIRGGVSYWGLAPPAECTPVAAAETALQFGCTVDLAGLAAYFDYYYPVLPVRRRPGGLTLGGAPGPFTAHAVALEGGPHASRILLHPAPDTPADPRAEALRARLRKGP